MIRKLSLLAAMLSVLSLSVADAQTAKTQTGTNYSYACSDLQTTVTRSNGGAPMLDTIIPGGSPCLSQGSTITIRNDDLSAALYVNAPWNVRYPWTVMEGGVAFGNYAVNTAIVQPGQTITLSYDPTVRRFPNGTEGSQKGGPIHYGLFTTWRVLKNGAVRSADVIPVPPMSAKGTRKRKELAKHFLEPAGTPETAPANWRSCPSDPANPATMKPTIWGIVWQCNNAAKNWSASLAATPNGFEIARLELRLGDQWVWDLRDGAWAIERSLIQVNNMPLSADRTYWEAYSFMLEPGPVAGTDCFERGACWQIIEDIHSNGRFCAKCDVPIQTELMPGDYLAIGIHNRVIKSNSFPGFYVYLSPKPVQRGVWHNVVRQFNFDARVGGDGFVKEWIDGVQVLDYTGPVGDDNSDRPYYQFQLYRANYGYATAYGGTPKGITIAEQIAAFQAGTDSLMDRVSNPPVIR